MTDIMMNILYITVYIFGGLALSFAAGVIIYDRTLTRGYSLKDYLFEKDRKIIWLDFFGGYILPIFLLANNSLSGEEAKTFISDITVVFGLMLVALILISFARALSSFLIEKIMKRFGEETNLNKEIFEQNNYAALFFNFAIVAFIVNILMQEDIFGAKNALLSFVVKGKIIGIVTVIALIVFKILELREKKFFELMFKEDNQAVGLNFFGYILAWEIIGYKLADYYTIGDYATLLKDGIKIKEFMFDISAAILMVIIFFEIAKIVVKAFIKVVLKEDIDSEIYEQKNLGSAFGMMIVYLGLAIMITGVMFG